MQAILKDECLAERMIMGFHESEVYVPEFRMNYVHREASKLIFNFSKTYEETVYTQDLELKFGDGTFTTLYAEIKILGGHSINITYTLTWWKYGGGDGPSRPSPSGNYLVLDHCLAS